MNSPLKAIRAKCLDCSTSARGVKFCPCHGKDGKACALWPFRFGKRPNTLKKGPGAWLLDPERVSASVVPIEECAAELHCGRKTAEGLPFPSAGDSLGGNL